MTQNITQILADNIKKMRIEKKWSQDDLATKMNIARPTISKWENAQSEPSASQLAELCLVFGVSSEVLLGSMNKISQKAVVVDTSILMRKPAIISELIELFDEVIIPDIVIKELNYQKDKKPKRSENQRAWLAMANLTKLKDERTPRLMFVESEINQDSINDEKIANIAIKRAIKSINDQVFIYTDDIYFRFLVEKYSNLTVLTPMNFEEHFPANDEFDPLITQEMFSAIKSRNPQALMKIDPKKVNINRHDTETGFTPLILAIRNRDTKMINLLIEKFKNLDLEVKDKSKYTFTPLLNACQIQNLEIMRLLIEAGADVNMCGSGVNHGNTPIMVCAWEHFIEGVKLLMEQDISYNQQDNNGFTALHKACIKHSLPIARMLIEKTDLKIRDHKNKLAIEHIDPNHNNSKALFDLFRNVSKNNGKNSN